MLDRVVARNEGDVVVRQIQYPTPFMLWKLMVNFTDLQSVSDVTLGSMSSLDTKGF
jgi:hypothetical protein